MANLSGLRRENLIAACQDAGAAIGAAIADAIDRLEARQAPPHAVRGKDLTPAPPEVLKTRDAAKFLSISDRTLFRLRKEGLIATVMIGGSRRYAREELERFVRENMRRGSGNAQAGG
jgi:excisionase family DNA binding protein